MGVKRKGHHRPTAISHGRPPQFQKPAASLSSKATRTLIRSHHQLHKALAQAKARGDHAKAKSLQLEIDSHGGLESYQQASIKGQSSERGGDTSRLLMEWLRTLDFPNVTVHDKQKMRLLEVGALSANNACSRSSLFDVTRIDLHSQSAEILQQDFMKRPLPRNENEMFDIISLSLVLNYVPEAAGRGDMLRRTCQFLRPSSKSADSSAPFPCLFLVVPAPCVTNSRYLNESKLSDVMGALGYTMIKKKISPKLAYYLWTYDHDATKNDDTFKKVEVAGGASKNNFAIVLR
ncbi:hypothetical protein L228DRAFT_212832 [Xylona heveae TC161]|uniref:25S rRNA adenine-N(1) methyltransferase n=1 Tax=Xylona heveae (strain CBS 132557 / TC161) TaxID=1328760 RepID=A0A165FSN2_XYLHT|nr:hypothetical protein L228DRAFT_212832 [Xylona heveae TC161]KZF21327.1 hypothetical protein L228DRAFT_212832 [Xylona heveae TC161]